MPIANDLRPTEIGDFFGQDHVINNRSWLRSAILNDNLSSIILFGPPGSGKTTLAGIIANLTKSRFVHLNATGGSAKELKSELENAQKFVGERKTIIFIDEIHRFNKSQQDVLLPFIERGVITLIGATTENPSFTVISPIISRSKVIELRRLEKEDLSKILDRALKKFPTVKLDKSARELLLESANGDARILLNLFEDVMNLESKVLKKTDIENLNIIKTLKYDKTGEEHYNIISALHKSMRDSDPDAAVYWMMRMLDAGEDPLYIARRLVRFASEDIGLADPHSLLVTIAVYDACRFLGLPECDVHLAQAVIHLSCAPKSNACYKAVLSARSDIKKYGNLDVPKNLRNASTKLMEKMGYGKGYKYAHDFKDAKLSQQHLPDGILDHKYYFPSEMGLEKRIHEKRLTDRAD